MRLAGLLAGSLLAATSISPAPSLAQSAPDVCSHQQTTKDMRDCADQEYQAADAALNAVYSDIMKLLETNRQVALTKAELAWIQYRDAHCQFEASAYQGGTLAGPTQTFCSVDITQQRTQQLQNDLDYLRKL